MKNMMMVSLLSLAMLMPALMVGAAKQEPKKADGAATALAARPKTPPAPTTHLETAPPAAIGTAAIMPAAPATAAALSASLAAAAAEQLGDASSTRSVAIKVAALEQNEQHDEPAYSPRFETLLNLMHENRMTSIEHVPTSLIASAIARSRTTKLKGYRDLSTELASRVAKVQLSTLTSAQPSYHIHISRRAERRKAAAAIRHAASTTGKESAALAAQTAMGVVAAAAGATAPVNATVAAPASAQPIAPATIAGDSSSALTSSSSSATSSSASSSSSSGSSSSASARGGYGTTWM